MCPLAEVLRAPFSSPRRVLSYLILIYRLEAKQRLFGRLRGRGLCSCRRPCSGQDGRTCRMTRQCALLQHVLAVIGPRVGFLRAAVRCMRSLTKACFSRRAWRQAGNSRMWADQSMEGLQQLISRVRCQEKPLKTRKEASFAGTT